MGKKDLSERFLRLREAGSSPACPNDIAWACVCKTCSKAVCATMLPYDLSNAEAECSAEESLCGERCASVMLIDARHGPCGVRARGTKHVKSIG